MTLATFPKMRELGNVRDPRRQAVSSLQAPFASRVTDRWHLVTASLGLGLDISHKKQPLPLALFSIFSRDRAASAPRGRLDPPRDADRSPWRIGPRGRRRNPLQTCRVRRPRTAPARGGAVLPGRRVGFVARARGTSVDHSHAGIGARSLSPKGVRGRARPLLSRSGRVGGWAAASPCSLKDRLSFGLSEVTPPDRADPTEFPFDGLDRQVELARDPFVGASLELGP
jgi:hypothetical protein